VYVPLTETAVEQLRELARREFRDTKGQAAWLILDGLRRAGLHPDRQPTEAMVGQSPGQRP
jgi:hypothetical protein